MIKCECGCDKWDEIRGQIGKEVVIYSKCLQCGTVYVTPAEYYGQTNEEEYLKPNIEATDKISTEEICMFRWEMAQGQDLNGNYRINWKELEQ